MKIYKLCNLLYIMKKGKSVFYKKWWFWLIVIIVLGLIFLPIKSCHILGPISANHPLTGRDIWINYFSYFQNGCPM